MAEYEYDWSETFHNTILALSAIRVLRRFLEISLESGKFGWSLKEQSAEASEVLVIP